jgi:hypothetical protein
MAITVGLINQLTSLGGPTLYVYKFMVIMNHKLGDLLSPNCFFSGQIFRVAFPTRPNHFDVF